MCYRFSSVVAAAAIFILGSGARTPPQSSRLWAPGPGWQILQDHVGTPDVFRVGIYGERFSRSLQPPTSPRGGASASQNTGTQHTVATNAPRLLLGCENGVTALTMRLGARPTDVVAVSDALSRGNSAATSFPGGGLLVLMLEGESRIEIDLRDYPRRTSPVYLPEPFDTIQSLLRAETLYYWEVHRGRRVAFGWDDWAVEPDAVFPLEGLRALLDTARDPCGWGAD